MLKFYYNTGPNPKKVALFLEEAGLAYEAIPVDTRKGEQHTPAFRAINPNGKAPALVDGATKVFDSNAILLYLAEKEGKFLHADRGALLSWLMFVASGIGPYFGQSVHFGRMAPEKPPYAVNRYRKEAARHLQVLNDQIGDAPFVLGETYTIVDMAAWGWVIMLPLVLEGPERYDDFPNVKRWCEAIDARPAAKKARALGADAGFKTDMDEDARRHLFVSNY
jgi:GST-like protein